jgi:predicted Fe-Mo cluster-binding NifX family protein
MNEEADSLVVAFSTLDGFSISKIHFGEAVQFEIYRISAETSQKLESLINPHATEGHEAGSHHHHHPSDSKGSEKGAGIGHLLGQHGVQVMISRSFGANIKRMRQRFVPVKIDADNVKTAVGLLQSNWDLVRSSWLQGADRKHVVLRTNA